MIRYQKTIRSKELDEYKGFLTNIKSIGNDFLIKGDMWIPSIKVPANRPGTHIGRDPILAEYYQNTENPKYLKFTCSHLAETLSVLKAIKGKKTLIQLTITDDEISVTVNDTVYVIASKFDPEHTIDYCPNYNWFQDILDSSCTWYELSQELLQALMDGHPISIKGTIANAEEMTIVRLTNRLMKMKGASRQLNFTGEYTLVNQDNNTFDDTVCKFIIHMNYKNIECINQYYVRKYLVEQSGTT